MEKQRNPSSDFTGAAIFISSRLVVTVEGGISERLGRAIAF